MRGKHLERVRRCVSLRPVLIAAAILALAIASLSLPVAGSSTETRSAIVPTIAPAVIPECSIDGPGGVAANTTGHVYTIVPTVTAVAYAWTVGGGASIMGSSTGSSITVSSGPGPLFSVRVTYRAAAGDSGECAKFVNVSSPPACPNPCGPDTVWESSLTTYTSVNTAQIPQYFWSVTGSGTIEGPTTERDAKVRAGAPGTFTVKVILDGQLPVAPAGPASIHTRTVTIRATPPAPPDANRDATVLIHLKAPGAIEPCGFEQVPSCASVVSSGRLQQSYFAYVVVAGAYTNGAPRSGISGIQFGIQYDGAPGSGVDIVSWVSCGTGELPTAGWPASGEGNLVTWNPTTRCQIEVPDYPSRGASAIAGYFYLSAGSPDILRIVPHPADGAVRMRDCLLVETEIEGPLVQPDPSHLGSAAFSTGGDVAGYNPCADATPVLPETWSGIKTLYQGR